MKESPMKLHNFTSLTALGVRMNCWLISLSEVGIDPVGDWIDLASLHQSLNGLGDLGGRELSE